MKLINIINDNYNNKITVGLMMLKILSTSAIMHKNRSYSLSSGRIDSVSPQIAISPIGSVHKVYVIKGESPDLDVYKKELHLSTARNQVFVSAVATHFKDQTIVPSSPGRVMDEEGLRFSMDSESILKFYKDRNKQDGDDMHDSRFTINTFEDYGKSTIVNSFSSSITGINVLSRAIITDLITVQLDMAGQNINVDHHPQHGFSPDSIARYDIDNISLSTSSSSPFVITEVYEGEAIPRPALRSYLVELALQPGIKERVNLYLNQTDIREELLRLTDLSTCWDHIKALFDDGIALIRNELTFCSDMRAEVSEIDLELSPSEIEYSLKRIQVLHDHLASSESVDIEAIVSTLYPIEHAFISQGNESSWGVNQYEVILDSSELSAKINELDSTRLERYKNPHSFKSMVDSAPELQHLFQANGEEN